MTIQSIPQSTDIAEIVFCAVDNTISDSTEECGAVMTKVQKLLDWETFCDLETAINLRVYHAMQESFKKGWQMRGQV